MHARDADLRRHVEENARVRHTSFHNHVGNGTVEREQFRLLPSVYLIGDGGKGETIGDDILAGIERGSYDLRYHLRAGREEEQELRAHVDASRFFRHQEFAGLSAKLGPAGVLRVDDVGKFFLEPVDDGRLAGALAPLKNDELPAGHDSSIRYSNCRPITLPGTSLLKSRSLPSSRYTFLMPASIIAFQHGLQHHQWPQRYTSASRVSSPLSCASCI